MAGRALSRCTLGAISHSQKESGPASRGRKLALLLVLKSAASDGPPLFPGGPVTEEGAKKREGTLLRRRTSSRGP